MKKIINKIIDGYALSSSDIDRLLEIECERNPECGDGCPVYAKMTEDELNEEFQEWECQQNDSSKRIFLENRQMKNKIINELYEERKKSRKEQNLKEDKIIEDFIIEKAKNHYKTDKKINNNLIYISASESNWTELSKTYKPSLNMFLENSPAIEINIVENTMRPVMTFEWLYNNTPNIYNIGVLETLLKKKDE